MQHEDFVNGVTIIPASEKVKKQVERNGRIGTEDVYEMTYTPYVRVDTRIVYFRKLAALTDKVAVIEPVSVPQIDDKDSPFYNANMPAGFFWHVVRGEGQNFVRFLCCTMRVALYETEAWHSSTGHEVQLPDGKKDWTEERPRPSREGVATKQVLATTSDVNALAKAETGAIGRALGMAGILIVGTGVATFEDMAELRGTAEEAPIELPEAAQGQETAEQVRERLPMLAGELQARDPEAWSKFSAWWTERSKEGGWSKPDDAPLEVRRGMIRRLETALAEVQPSSGDSSQGNTDDVAS
jgi:hypothetical protein